ncbi:aldehyde dehydrogenase family protein [Bradyrhizobium stylosanthis]|uniref:aldehyde dehydrogenase family protein n=1 Tax=Bradyrhizobium stylosanthis TaxID=1803665 RepID=UPI001FDA7D5F|nr:aldehyde dehydrogenase family protein [Bradyrhizobium stylosanthis]
MISQEAAQLIARRVAGAIDDRAVCLLGSRPLGAIYPPTLLDHVRATSELVVEETFGPVLPIIRCPNEIDQIISIAKRDQVWTFRSSLLEQD